MLLQALHLLKQAQQSQLAKAETKIAHNTKTETVLIVSVDCYDAF